MKSLTVSVFVAAILISFAGRVFAQETVSLYLEPDKSGTVYFKEELEKVNKRDPKPYPAGQAVTEWMMVMYPGTYVGYVKPAQVNEDMTVNEGAPILLRPKDGSRTLAVVDDTFSPQVIELGPNWATVYYEGNAPAFFPWPSQQATPPPVPETVTVSSAPTQGGEIVAVTEAEEIVVPAATAAAPGESTMSVAPTTAPAPTPAPKAPATTAAAPSSSPATAPAPAPPAQTPELAPIAAESRPQVPIANQPPPPPITSKQITRVWEGTLVKTTPLQRTFGPDYLYVLEDASGERIAYVDLSKVLLFEPVEKYWNRQVIIDGTAERIMDTIPLVVTARVIRPKL